jgi:hypothetical protein
VGLRLGRGDGVGRRWVEGRLGREGGREDKSGRHAAGSVALIGLGGRYQGLRRLGMVHTYISRTKFDLSAREGRK